MSQNPTTKRASAADLVGCMCGASPYAKLRLSLATAITSCVEMRQAECLLAEGFLGLGLGCWV